MQTNALASPLAQNQPEINRRVRQQLAFTIGRSLPLAVQLMHRATLQGLAAIRKGQTPARQHIEAAKMIMDRSGFRLRDQGVEIKELSEMSRDELAAFVLAGEAELARRAKQVNATESEPNKSDLSDLID